VTKAGLLFKLYWKVILGDSEYRKSFLLALIVAAVLLAIIFYLVVLPDIRGIREALLYVLYAIYIAISWIIFAVPNPLRTPFTYLLLRRIYSLEFDAKNIIKYYVKLDIYVDKCLARELRTKEGLGFVLIVIALLVGLIIAPPLLITTWSIRPSIIIILELAPIILGSLVGYMRARAFKSTLLEGRNCQGSSEPPKYVREAINILGLSSDPYRFFSDVKASIGLLTFIAIVLGFLGLKGFDFGSIEEFIQKTINLDFPSNLSIDEVLRQYVRELLFILQFYIYPFTLTCSYYVFTAITLSFPQLKQLLLAEFSYDIIIPIVSIIIKGMWIGGIPSEFTNLLTAIPAILMTFSMGPVTHTLKLIAEWLIQCRSRSSPEVHEIIPHIIFSSELNS